VTATEQPKPPHACTLESLDHPDSAWNRAAAATEQGDPFCCRTEWHVSFHEAYYPKRRLHLCADGDNVLAFAEQRYVDIGLVLESLESMWYFGSPMLGKQSVALLDEFLAHHANAGFTPCVLLSGLLPGSQAIAEIERTLGRRYRILPLGSRTQSSASLDGGLDGFLSRRSGSWRRNLQQAARRATERGVTFERHAPRSADEAKSIFARMLAVEWKSWKGIGKCGMEEPSSSQFYSTMLRRLAVSGSGRVMFARHEGADIGFIFGGMAGTHYRGQQFSYVEEWSKSSIGNLLQIEQVRWLGEERATRYDMGPLMDYKPHWTEQQITIERRILEPKMRRS
jgi:CelD/BcsL family acetyltransferase involved in cellulose biosynthesis